jgi:hypothetical protein
MKTIVKVFLLFAVLSVCMANTSTGKNKDKHRNKRRVDAPGAGAPAAGAAGAAPAAVKVDKTAILTPQSNMPGLSQKPQIIIERNGAPSKSEVGADQLASENPCQLKQGYVLFQKKLDNNGKCFEY